MGAGRRPHQPDGDFGPQGTSHMENATVHRGPQRVVWDQWHIWPPFCSSSTLRPRWPPSSFSRDQCPPGFWTLAQCFASARNAFPLFFRFLKLILKVRFLARCILVDLVCSLSLVGRKNIHTDVHKYTSHTQKIMSVNLPDIRERICKEIITISNIWL